MFQNGNSFVKVSIAQGRGVAVETGQNVALVARAKGKSYGLALARRLAG